MNELLPPVAPFPPFPPGPPISSPLAVIPLQGLAIAFSVLAEKAQSKAETKSISPLKSRSRHSFLLFCSKIYWKETS